MAGGLKIEYHRDIFPGDWLTATRTLTDIYEKQGRSGPLIFYEVVMDVVNDRRRAGDQGKDHEDPAMTAADTRSRFAGIKPGDQLPQRAFKPDNVQSMLYNAVLWNGHRIHFDEPYAREVEGYPGLVIAGPLLGDWLNQCVDEWLGDTDGSWRSSIPTAAPRTSATRCARSARSSRSTASGASSRSRSRCSTRTTRCSRPAPPWQSSRHRDAHGASRLRRTQRAGRSHGIRFAPASW